ESRIAVSRTANLVDDLVLVIPGSEKEILRRGSQRILFRNDFDVALRQIASLLDRRAIDAAGNLRGRNAHEVEERGSLRGGAVGVDALPAFDQLRKGRPELAPDLQGVPREPLERRRCERAVFAGCLLFDGGMDPAPGTAFFVRNTMDPPCTGT